MPTLSTPRDYVKSMHVAARGRLSRYPVAIHSVLLSRFGYGIGPRLHSLFGLADVPKERWGDYLLDEKGWAILRRVNPSENREVVNDKFAFYMHCLANALPTIPVLCVIDQAAVGRDEAGVIVCSKEEWVEKLQNINGHLFLKLIDGSRGVDAFSIKKINQQWHYCDHAGTDADLYDFTMQRLASRRGWVVQPLIRAHSEFEKITSSNALCTLRAVTCLVDGATRLLYGVLRIPVGNNVTDNFSHGASGNIIAPIDLTTGELGVCRGSASRGWPNIVEIGVHPDTRNPISGFRIPLWEEVLALLDYGQQSLPALKTLGWDIAVTDNGPIIVEANATYDVDILQVSHQAGLGVVLESLLEENKTI